MPGGSGVVGFIWTPSVTLSGLDTGQKEGWKKLPATSQVGYLYLDFKKLEATPQKTRQNGKKHS